MLHYRNKIKIVTTDGELKSKTKKI